MNDPLSTPPPSTKGAQKYFLHPLYPPLALRLMTILPSQELCSATYNMNRLQLLPWWSHFTCYGWWWWCVAERNLEEEATPLFLQASLHAVRKIKAEKTFIRVRHEGPRKVEDPGPPPSCLPCTQIQFNPPSCRESLLLFNRNSYSRARHADRGGANKLFVGWFCRPWITPLCQSGLEKPSNPNSKLDDFTQERAS